MALDAAVPVHQRFAAKLLVDGLNIIEQMRRGIEEAGLVLHRHLIAQPQGPLDRDAGIAEVGIVEDLGYARWR